MFETTVGRQGKASRSVLGREYVEAGGHEQSIRCCRSRGEKVWLDPVGEEGGRG